MPVATGSSAFADDDNHGRSRSELRWSWLWRQRRVGHRPELDPRNILERPFELDLAAARGNAAVGLQVGAGGRGRCLLTLEKILRYALLRIPGHDLVARLVGAVGELQRIGQPVGPRQAAR